MNIVLHVGGREFFKLDGKDQWGEEVPLEGAILSENTLDPHIATITPNPGDNTVIAVDGLMVGSTTGTIDLVNADGQPAQSVVLNITVLADDVVEVDVAQIGEEVKTGTPFPTT